MKKSFVLVTTKAMSLLLWMGIVFCSITAVVPISAQAHKNNPLQTNISIEAGKQPLEKLLTQIVATTHVKLAYDVKEVEKYTVTLKEKNNITVEALLKKALQQTNLTFESHANTIVIYEKGKEGTTRNIASGYDLTNVAYQIQKQIIQGIVRDYNGPLHNASVYIKGTSTGVSTNEKGEFSIEANSGEVTVTISLVGYQSRDVVVKAGSDNIITLQRATTQLDSVVVIGYGTQKKAQVTGAVSTVQLDKVTSRVFNNPAEVLQGKVAGVLVMNNGGDPTASPSVQVRGVGGLNGNGALWVVDGVPDGPLVNPNDIESISVLKDASAAIYGARASGGVILITTKKGSAAKTVISADAKYGYQTPHKLIHSLNAADQSKMIRLAAVNAGKNPNDNVFAAFDPAKYPDGQITRADWMDEIFRKGIVQDYSVTLSGGNNKATYYTSFNYRDNQAIMLNTQTKRFIMRMNADYQLKSWLKFGENMSYTITNGNGANTTDANNGIIVMAMQYPSSVAPYTSDGKFSGLPADFASNYGDLFNPVAKLMRIDLSRPNYEFYFNPYIDVNLTKGFTFRSSLSYKNRNNFDKEFTPRMPEVGKQSLSNDLTYGTGINTSVIAEQMLNYTHSFAGKHNLKATLVYSYEHYKWKGEGASGQGFPDERPELRYLTNATLFSNAPWSGQTESALLSYMARVNYDYEGKYMLTAAVRRDGTSQVPSINRWQVFPSFSAGWRISEEKSMHSIDWLSELKLRASWGVLGNLSGFPGNAYEVPLSSTYSYLGQTATRMYGYVESGISNPDLKWVKTIPANIGIDASVLNRRLTFAADFFINRTENTIVEQPLSSQVGISGSKWINSGIAEDRGFDLSIGYSDKTKGGLQYSVNGTLSSFTNKLVEFNEPGSDKYSPVVRATLKPGWRQQGESQLSFHTIKTAGIFKSQEEIDAYVDKKTGNKIQPNAVPGDLKFVDANDNGKIDASDDKVFVGTALPKFSYGFSFNLAYQGFDLNLFLQGVQGNKVFNGMKYIGLYAGASQGVNLWDKALGAWTAQNPNTDIPRVSLNDPNGTYTTTSDWYIENASFLRVKSFTLGYNVPATLTKRTGLNNIRIYLTGSNLLTFTKYSGLDPEIGLGQQGIDRGLYPQARSIIIGMNINL